MPPAIVPVAASSSEFAITRLGVIMRSRTDQPHEAWGVLNPGGVRSSDGTLHLFPRLVAEGNYSRIGHGRVHFDGGVPTGVERLGLALEPREFYEVSPAGGGVEDARVTFVPLLACYVMTYTAYVPIEPRVAVAVSVDLAHWRRLGTLHYDVDRASSNLNFCGNKDAAIFPDAVLDPQGIPSLAFLHRPTISIDIDAQRVDMTAARSGLPSQAHIWISYVPLDAVLADMTNLTSVRRHEPVLVPEQPWEAGKIGTGAPPVRLPYGWVLPYHAVSADHGWPRYCMGIAVLDALRPSRVLYRTRRPVLEPETDYERHGLVANVVFPTAADLRADGALDVYYGAADDVIAVARLVLPTALPSPACP